MRQQSRAAKFVQRVQTAVALGIKVRYGRAHELFNLLHVPLGKEMSADD